ncbi:MAG: hypothetical protein H6865_02125 [Rhodospirillales bacterium]|nr:hypothetical protein [Rhodospirillales bacterium]USO07040.1 MAG: hypothetical protein H6866_06260 [Rhodospirillales bacterium]
MSAREYPDVDLKWIYISGKPGGFGATPRYAVEGIKMRVDRATLNAAAYLAGHSSPVPRADLVQHLGGEHYLGIALGQLRTALGLLHGQEAAKHILAADPKSDSIALHPWGESLFETMRNAARAGGNGTTHPRGAAVINPDRPLVASQPVRTTHVSGRAARTEPVARIGMRTSMRALPVDRPSLNPRPASPPEQAAPKSAPAQTGDGPKSVSALLASIAKQTPVSKPVPTLAPEPKQEARPEPLPEVIVKPAPAPTKRPARQPARPKTAEAEPTHPTDNTITITGKSGRTVIDMQGYTFSVDASAKTPVCELAGPKGNQTITARQAKVLCVVFNARGQGVTGRTLGGMFFKSSKQPSSTAFATIHALREAFSKALGNRAKAEAVIKTLPGGGGFSYAAPRPNGIDQIVLDF